MGGDFESQVLAAEERLRQAQLYSDVQALDELISPDLLFTGLGGQMVRKEDDLAFHRAGLLKLASSKVVEQHIQAHSAFAVVSVLLHLTGEYQGQPIDQHMRYTRVWARTDGGALQVLAGHMSEVV